MKLFLALLLLFHVNSYPTSQDQILGYWLSPKQDIKIKIYKNQEGYYGKITWIKDGSIYSKNKLDLKNPDPMLRNREIIGLTILKNFRFDMKRHKWDMGKIYHPKYGKTFKGKMNLSDTRTLEITGYWGVFHDTGTWTRVN